jgi:hypothetical protein
VFSNDASGAAQMAKKRKYQVELKGVPSELMAPIKVKRAHEIQRLFALAREFLKLGEPTSLEHVRLQWAIVERIFPRPFVDAHPGCKTKMVAWSEF